MSGRRGRTDFHRRGRPGRTGPRRRGVRAPGPPTGTPRASGPTGPLCDVPGTPHHPGEFGLPRCRSWGWGDTSSAGGRAWNRHSHRDNRTSRNYRRRSVHTCDGYCERCGLHGVLNSHYSWYLRSCPQLCACVSAIARVCPQLCVCVRSGAHVQLRQNCRAQSYPLGCTRESNRAHCTRPVHVSRTGCGCTRGHGARVHLCVYVSPVRRTNDRTAQSIQVRPSTSTTVHVCDRVEPGRTHVYSGTLDHTYVRPNGVRGGYMWNQVHTQRTCHSCTCSFRVRKTVEGSAIVCGQPGHSRVRSCTTVSTYDRGEYIRTHVQSPRPIRTCIMVCAQP